MEKISSYLPYSQIKNIFQQTKSDPSKFLVTDTGNAYVFYKELKIPNKLKNNIVAFNQKRNRIKKRKLIKKELDEKRRYNIFLDIDSTITNDHTEYPDPRARRAFEEMNRLHHKIYLVSGRPHEKVLDAIKRTKASKNAIAENGGLIIEGRKITSKLSDNKFVQDAYSKLSKKLTSLKKARNQHSCTEIILDKRPEIHTVRKHIDAMQLPVEITASKRFYHLHKIGIDKGAALTKFLSDNRRTIDFESTVSIGDSEIDIPMIRMIRYGFALGNAPREVKELVNQQNRLALSNFSGVLEAFIKLEPKFKTFAKEKLNFNTEL